MNSAPCLSCDVVNGQRETLGGAILETTYFHAHQDVAYPIPGLVILAAKRHFHALDEMSEEESQEFISLLHRIRRAQRELLCIDHAYYFYNEDTSHHFHFWLVPRYNWMHRFGKSVQSVRPVLRHARDQMNTPENLAEVHRCVALLRESFAANAR